MPSSLLRQTLARGLRVKRWLLLGPFVSLGLVLAMLWALVGWFVLVYPHSLIRDAQQDLTSTSVHTAQGTAAVLREAEAALRTLDLMLMTRGPTAISGDSALHLMVDQLREDSRGVIEVMLANTDGRLWRPLAASGDPLLRLSSTLFFNDLSATPAPRVAVGAPVVLQPNGRSWIPVAMRLSVPSGAINAAVALVDVQHVAQIYRANLQRRTMAITLVRNDGVLVMREPALPALVGHNIRLGHPERTLPPGAPASGLLTDGIIGVDGRERVISYDSLPGFPLQVFVSLERAQVLGGYSTQRRAVLGFSILASLVALSLTAWISRLHKQARLREAELSATAEASPVGLFRCDTDGRVVYANATYRQLVDVNDDNLAWGWLAHWPAHQREFARQEWQDMMGSDQSFDRTLWMYGSDGTKLQISLRTRPLKLGKKLVAQVGSITDQTLHNEQQGRLQQLGDIVDQLPDAVVQFDQEGRLVYANPTARLRLGLSLAEPLSSISFDQLVPPDELPRLQQEALPHARSHGHWLGRTWIRDRQGTVTPVDGTLLLHTSARGDVHLYSWTLRDISLELQIEQERIRNLALMSAVTHSASAMVLALDQSQQVLFCNHSFQAYFGLDTKAWLMRPAAEVLGPILLAQLGDAIQSALSGESSVHEQDSRGLGRAPSEHMEFRLSPLRTETGTIIGVLVVGRDITEAKQTQQRLLQASHTDPLTKLLNRAGFAEHIQALLHQSAQQGELVALLYLDLDRFKPVNDQHGHPVGDALLKAVAGRLRHALRPQDLVARLGGDEFSVFLPQLARASDAQVVADKLVQALTTPFRIGELELQIGTSVGFCVEWAAQAEIDQLVSQADAQLYQAKRAGRGRAQGHVQASPPAPPSLT